jgi:hypothetical protein
MESTLPRDTSQACALQVCLKLGVPATSSAAFASALLLAEHDLNLLPFSTTPSARRHHPPRCGRGGPQQRPVGLHSALIRLCWAWLLAASLVAGLPTDSTPALSTLPAAGLIGTAPSQELLEIWNTREAALVEAGPEGTTLGGVLHTRPLGRCH